MCRFRAENSDGLQPRLRLDYPTISSIRLLTDILFWRKKSGNYEESEQLNDLGDEAYVAGSPRAALIFGPSCYSFLQWTFGPESIVSANQGPI